MAYIIVSGNEKGGSGKTTSAAHLIIDLTTKGFKVSSIDLDHRQQSLTSYINNRKKFADSENIPLLLPDHHTITRSNAENLKDASDEEQSMFYKTFEKLQSNDFIIIDTPGSDTFLSRLAHSYADTVMTPINDSFIDVDLLGKMSDSEDINKVQPGVYSAMVWEQKLMKAAKEKKEIDWVIMRNRSSTLDNINKRNIQIAIEKLAKKFGFRIVPGFSERVIFRELFLHGLTLSDAGSTPKVRMNASIIAARQELRDFIKALSLPAI
jgi:chromosome partitioning protein